MITFTTTACSDSTSPPAGVNKLNHIVVIYLENRGFDHMFGEFPGAEGRSEAPASAVTQVDVNGTAYTTLPQVAGSPFPTTLANEPFDIDQYLPPTVATRDLVHRFYQEQMQIDDGKMDKFAAISDAQGLVMGYYHTMDLPLATEAQNYTLCDHFFHSAFGGSFLNHMWLIAAASPTFPNAPASMIAQLDEQGNVITDGAVTPDKYVVNTAYTVNAPHPSNVPAENLVPNQTMPTIGDRLSAKGITWAWYSGGWNQAIAGNPDPLFQFHHQPFAFFANYADGTQGRAEHLKDEEDFLAAAAAGTLPAVSFVKPVGGNNEHPGYTDIMTGEEHVMELINAVRNGPNWKDAAIIVTYDENGGFWDHVAPPKIDRWGPGTRVPAVIISPFARRGYVDHTQYETVSILALIEQRWGLAALSDRDAKATPLTNAFDFTQRQPQ
jgi:phospholipase C